MYMGNPSEYKGLIATTQFDLISIMCTKPFENYLPNFKNRVDTATSLQNTHCFSIYMIIRINNEIVFFNLLLTVLIGALAYT